MPSLKAILELGLKEMALVRLSGKSGSFSLLLTPVTIHPQKHTVALGLLLLMMKSHRSHDG